MIRAWVEDLTGGSLQSAVEIFRAGSAFDIGAKALCLDAERLREVFQCRNEIVHEMDVDFQPNRSRRQRSFELMTGHTQLLFDVARNFLSEVEAKVPAQS